MDRQGAPELDRPGAAKVDRQGEAKVEGQGANVCLFIGSFASLFKEERERFGDFNFVFRAYSLHTGILYLSNFEIMQRKKGVTGLDFPGDLLLCMFLTYF